MIASKIECLIVNFITNQASKAELEVLEVWLEDSNNQELFKTYVKTNYVIEYNMRKFDIDKVKSKVFEEMASESKAIKLKRIRKTMSYAAAAVFLGIALTAYFYKSSIQNNFSIETPVIVDTKILPGTDKATLTLEDGSVVLLEKGNSFLMQNASSNGEQIVYGADKTKKSKVSYNYLTIPRGGQFYIILSDGTKVWLNSESQLKYPVTFNDGETRQVELVYGEAYFDVSPISENNGAKFKVINQSQEVEVLGTEFNIKAYKDETNVYTTLVEGKVNVGSGSLQQKLTPNQQSSLDVKNNRMVVKKVDVKNEISWKNGIFSFNGKPLKDIMKVISRWYNVDVVFKNKELENIEFVGIIKKDQSIEYILSIMQSTSIIHYDLSNRTITLE